MGRFKFGTKLHVFEHISCTIIRRYGCRLCEYLCCVSCTYSNNDRCRTTAVEVRNTRQKLLHWSSEQMFSHSQLEVFSVTIALDIEAEEEFGSLFGELVGKVPDM